MDILYVISSDGLDDRCFQRFSACLGSLSRQTVADTVRACIADYSTESALPKLSIPGSLKWDYFHTPLDAPFNKPFCINHGYKRFGCGAQRLFFFSDIDLVYPESFIERLVGRYGAVDPMVCATALQFYQQPEFEEYTSDYARARSTIHDDIRYEGGCLMISTALFEHLRGFDERYFGWGGEDDDFFMRAGRAGMFVVDESVELVHMYHPGDRRKQSANTERLNRRRRDRSSWFEERPWGEWSLKPETVDREKATLETGLCTRLQYHCAFVEENGPVIRKLRESRNCPVSTAEYATWILSDGRSSAESIARVLEDGILDSSARSAEAVNASINRLRSMGLVGVGAWHQSRPLLQVGVVNRDLMRPADFQLFVWVLAHEFDVVVNPAAEWEADITLVYDDAGEYVSPPSNTAGMRVLWTSANRYPAEALSRYDLVLAPMLVSHEHRGRMCRVPRWLASFSWDTDHDDGWRVSPSVLTGASPGANTAERTITTIRVAPPAGGATFDCMRRHGPVIDLRDLADDPAPLEKWHLYRRAVFVAIDEYGALPGAAGDELVLAMAAGAIPVYRGDPAVAWDLNPRRFIDGSNGFDDSGRERIARLAAGGPARDELAALSLFRGGPLPMRSMPGMIAREVLQAWTECNRSASSKHR